MAFGVDLGYVWVGIWWVILDYEGFGVIRRDREVGGDMGV